MSRYVKIQIWPPRLTVLGKHVHHGLLGVLLAVHDIRDWRGWFGDLLK